MRYLLLVILLFFTIQASANVPFFICGYEDIQEITWFEANGDQFGKKVLSQSESSTLESIFDDLYNCDEGVDLQGPIQKGTEAEYLATCHADSLGAKQVRIQLTCEKIILN